jgi:hypothetical protein
LLSSKKSSDAEICQSLLQSRRKIIADKKNELAELHRQIKVCHKQEARAREKRKNVQQYQFQVISTSLESM